jgi:hypothetical protein
VRSLKEKLEIDSSGAVALFARPRGTKKRRRSRQPGTPPDDAWLKKRGKRDGSV